MKSNQPIYVSQAVYMALYEAKLLKILHRAHDMDIYGEVGFGKDKLVKCILIDQEFIQSTLP